MARRAFAGLLDTREHDDTVITLPAAAGSYAVARIWLTGPGR
jgi:hypothetical protein